MMLIAYFLALVVSFYLLAEVSDKYFVISLDKMSKQLNMSHDMAGATFMAIGSSAPELFVAIIALVRPGGHEDIGVGTIVGSALFNLLVIVGASAVVKETKLTWQPVIRDLAFYGISILALYFVLKSGTVGPSEALVLVALYGVYIYSVINWRKWFKYSTTDDDFVEEEEEEKEIKSGWKLIFRPFDWFLSVIFPTSKHYVASFFVSIICIGLLCWVLVESAIGISHILQVPEVVIALTVIAVGTSVPDMISSIIVAKQGRGGMAVSNAVGSNIFDIFIGLGLPWLIKSVATSDVINTDVKGLNVSVGLLFGSVLFILAILMFKKWRMSKGVGMFLIILYILYVMWEILKLYVIEI